MHLLYGMLTQYHHYWRKGNLLMIELKHCETEKRSIVLQLTLPGVWGLTLLGASPLGSLVCDYIAIHFTFLNCDYKNDL